MLPHFPTRHPGGIDRSGAESVPSYHISVSLRTKTPLPVHHQASPSHPEDNQTAGQFHVKCVKGVEMMLNNSVPPPATSNYPSGRPFRWGDPSMAGNDLAELW